MQERPRFAIALAGVAGCLCLAAGIMITAPRAGVPPPVPSIPVARAERLPRLPVPSWSDVKARVVSRPAARPVSRSRAQEAPLSDATPLVRPDAPQVEAATATPAVLIRQSSIVNRQFPVPVVLSNAPPATSADEGTASGERGPVTDALVTAGTHIGGGFRTVGRTLKKVF
jgi:hypothetical protein